MSFRWYIVCANIISKKYPVNTFYSWAFPRCLRRSAQCYKITLGWLQRPDSIYIHNSHNVSNLVYHFVCPTKYRRIVITETVDESLKQICEGIELRYDWITFLEIGADKDHVHFLVQSTPDYSPTKIITIIKSITAKRIFAGILQWRNNFREESFGVAFFCVKRGVQRKWADNKRICEKSR